MCEEALAHCESETARVHRGGKSKLLWGEIMDSRRLGDSRAIKRSQQDARANLPAQSDPSSPRLEDVSLSGSQYDPGEPILC